MQHIVILRQPFFEWCFLVKRLLKADGSMNKVAPYGKVSIGDKILLKETGKDVTAIAIVKDVKYYELTPEIVEEIRLCYGKQIGTDKFVDWETTP